MQITRPRDELPSPSRYLYDSVDELFSQDTGWSLAIALLIGKIRPGKAEETGRMIQKQKI